MSSDFETFWSVYPRRAGKAMALSKWKSITGNGLLAKCRDRDGNTMEVDLYATADEIIEGVKAYRYINIDTEERYILHPTTWLNRGMWEDMEEDERSKYARKMDAILERMNKQKLRVVG